MQLNATVGIGTNKTGANLTLAGGRSTGNAIGGSLIFQTSPAGASGSSVNTLEDRVAILGDGGLTVFDLGTDPANPVNGSFVMWQSDGNDTGADGDIIFKAVDSVGGVVTTNFSDILSNIIEDLTPQLGGNLDANNKDVTNISDLSFNATGGIIDFETTGAIAEIKVADNDGGAWVITSAGNTYITIDTTDSDEKVIIDKNFIVNKSIGSKRTYINKTNVAYTSLKVDYIIEYNLTTGDKTLTLIEIQNSDQIGIEYLIYASAMSGGSKLTVVTQGGDTFNDPASITNTKWETSAGNTFIKIVSGSSGKWAVIGSKGGTFVA